MILNILEILFRGLRNSLAYLIQSTMDQCRIPNQEPSYSLEYTKNLSLLQVDPIQLQPLLLCKCVNTTKCTPPCECVLAFSQTFFKGLVTHFTTPLDPSNDVKLDHSSALDDRYANKFVSLDSTAIYPKPGHKLLYTPMTGEMKCPIGYTFALRIPFHLLQC